MNSFAIFNDRPFTLLPCEDPFMENLFYQEELAGSTESCLNNLSHQLNLEIKKDFSPVGTASVDNFSNQESSSVYANHEEDFEDKMLTLDSSERSQDGDSIENILKKEIEKCSLDFLVAECCKSKEIKDPVKNSEKMRFKTTKTPLQIQRLQESLIQFPTRFPKKERKKLALEIGLEEVQVYKWYYDNKPKKANKKSKKSV